MVGEVHWAWSCNWVFSFSSSQGMSWLRGCKSSWQFPLLTSDLCPRFDRSSSCSFWAMFVGQCKRDIRWLHAAAFEVLAMPIINVADYWRGFSLHLAVFQPLCHWQRVCFTLMVFCQALWLLPVAKGKGAILHRRRANIASSNLSIHWVAQPRILFEPLCLEISDECFVSKFLRFALEENRLLWPLTYGWPWFTCCVIISL